MLATITVCHGQQAYQDYIQQEITGADSRDWLQCLIEWPRDAFNLPVDEDAGHCVMLVLFFAAKGCIQLAC